jgi:hypothetical protein
MADENEGNEVIPKTVEEARQTLDYQIQISQNLENKSFRLLRMNLVILGAIFTAFSIAPSIQIPIGNFVNLFSMLGFGIFASIDTRVFHRFHCHFLRSYFGYSIIR